MRQNGPPNMLLNLRLLSKEEVMRVTPLLVHLLGQKGRQRHCHRQLQQQAKTIRIGFEELAQESAQLRMRRTIRMPLAQMNRKSSDGQIL